MNRCAKHTAIAPHNLHAHGEECGACIMREVAYLHTVVMMDLLDTLASLLRQHAQARIAIGQLREQLAFYTGDTTPKES